MTHRYYYDDSYVTSFQAEVLQNTDYEGQPALVLVGTYFYPTSGGQPHDVGTINGSEVVNVLSRPSDGAILHVLDGPVSGEILPAEIDWGRRFDHMQQHTGQHILSQSFLKVLGARTVSFHLGADSSTIDLDLNQLDDDRVSQVEELANQVVWENRTVQVQNVTLDEALDIPMRKKPPLDSDALRLVFITDFDVSACGGTHVSNTGEVGVIKIVGWERRGDTVRAGFVCGKRALSDYRAKNQVIRNLSTQLTTGYWELENSISNQIDEISQLKRQLRRSQQTLIDYQVEGIISEINHDGDENPVIRVFAAMPMKELRIVANQLVTKKQVLSLLASVGDRTSLVFARSEDIGVDMNVLIKKAFTQLGSGSGGGSPSFAQGSSQEIEIEKIQEVLDSLGREL